MPKTGLFPHRKSMELTVESYKREIKTAQQLTLGCPPPFAGSTGYGLRHQSYTLSATPVRPPFEIPKFVDGLLQYAAMIGRAGTIQQRGSRLESRL
jgi:hypothetical protein